MGNKLKRDKDRALARLMMKKKRVPLPEEPVEVRIGKVGNYSYRKIDQPTLAREMYDHLKGESWAKFDDVKPDTDSFNLKETCIQISNFLTEKYRIDERLIDGKPTTPYHKSS